MTTATAAIREQDEDAVAARERERAYQKHKTTIHQELVEALDLSRIETLDRERLRRELRGMTDALAKSRAKAGALLEPAEKARLVQELMDEFYGLGPLEPLLADPRVSDVLVNSPSEVYVERDGRLEASDVVFADEAHLLRIIQRVVGRSGRRIDEASATVDARLPDGSRVNAVVRPVSVGGPFLSIRRFGAKSLGVEEMLARGSFTPEMALFLKAALACRLSVLISGGTGSGKTTLLGALSEAIPDDERVVSIEETAELQLRNRHVVRMETRPPNTEGAGQVTQRDLLRNSLRMRPDRIIVGEVRGPEAFDMLQALNTGHDGSLSTIHANDVLDALFRLEMMMALTGMELPLSVTRQYITMGIRLVVHLARQKGGARRIARISEVLPLNAGNYELRDVFVFETLGVDAHGVTVGHFRATGYRPACLDRLRLAGRVLSDDLFEARILPPAGARSDHSLAAEIEDKINRLADELL